MSFLLIVIGDQLSGDELTFTQAKVLQLQLVRLSSTSSKRYEKLYVTHKLTSRNEVRHIHDPPLAPRLRQASVGFIIGPAIKCELCTHVHPCASGENFVSDRGDSLKEKADCLTSFIIYVVVCDCKKIYVASRPPQSLRGFQATRPTSRGST